MRELFREWNALHWGLGLICQSGREAKFNVTFQLGALSSALEHAIPEQMFVTPDTLGEAVSAVKALSKAMVQGQRIYHITAANQASVLPNINHNDLTMSEIRNALAVGREVITHTDPIAVPGWTGAGYVIFDPEVGDGAWKIGGGMNGPFLAGFLVATALIIGILALFATFPLAGLLATAAPLAVIGSLMAFLGLEKLYGSDPVFWTCFQAGFAAAFLILGIGDLFISGVSAQGMAGAAGGVLSLPFAIAACIG